jgi:hypothetical protein
VGEGRRAEASKATILSAPSNTSVPTPLRTYRASLRHAVTGSAGPYGYTLTVWTSGAVLAHARGLPTTLDALLFMIGAVAGFGAVGWIAFGGFARHLTPSPQRAALWTSFHVLPVAISIGAAALTAHFLKNSLSWPLAGFFATTIYLLVYALHVTAGHRRDSGL